MKKLAGVLAATALAVIAFQTDRHWRRSSQALPTLSASERETLRDDIKDDPSKKLNGSLLQTLDNMKGDASSVPVAVGQPVQPPAADPAAGCSYVRLDQNNGSMAQVQVRDQGPYGDCYSAAASQMFDAYRFARAGDTNYGRQTSETSAAIGLSEAMNKDGDPFEGGWTCKVIDYLRKEGGHDRFAVGMCTVKAEQFRMQRTAVLSEQWDDYQAEIGNRTKQLQQAQNDPKAKLDPDLVAGIAEKHALKLLNDRTLSAMSATAGEMPPVNVLGDFFSYRRERFIQAVTTYQCFKKDAPEVVKNFPACAVKPNPQRTPDYFRSVIDAQLRQGGLPVQIDYCDGILMGGRDYAGVDHSPQPHAFCSPLANGQSTGGHASLLIGRRFQPGENGQAGKCQYLLRNSWGAEKWGGKQHMLPGEMKAPSLNPSRNDIYSTDWEFVDHKGSLWIDAGVLANSVYGVDYLDDHPAAPTVAGSHPAEPPVAVPEPASAR